MGEQAEKKAPKRVPLFYLPSFLFILRGKLLLADGEQTFYFGLFLLSACITARDIVSIKTTSPPSRLGFLFGSLFQVEPDFAVVELRSGQLLVCWLGRSPSCARLLANPHLDWSNH